MNPNERKTFENMTSQQKTEYYRKREEEKRQNILQRLIAKGEELKLQGKNWKEISHTLHMSRYKELVEAIKQELEF